MTREGREGGRASETRCSDDEEEEEEVHITLQLQVIGIALDPGTFLHTSEIHYIFLPDYRLMEPKDWSQPYYVLRSLIGSMEGSCS